MVETVAALLRRAARQLSLRGIETAALDARLLLQEATGMSHADIIAEPDMIPAPQALATFWNFMERCAGLEPVSRILGTRSFYGRDFTVNPAVLDPRADTETLVDAAVALMAGKNPIRLLDLGTGSGAIAITLLAEMPHATGVATDLSGEALAVASANARRHGVLPRLELLTANWFLGVAGQFDLIVSNPPYIPVDEIAGLSVCVRDYDPLGALDGGPDGLSAYHSIAAGAPIHMAPGAHILLEIGAGQETAVQDLFAAQGFAAERQYKDLAGYIRCLGFNLPS